MAGAQSGAQFFQQVFGGSWITQGIWVAAELGIADLLSDGPRSAADLAEQTHTHRDSLYRVLRALAGVGVFAQDAEDRFSLTPLSDSLRTNGSLSQRPFGIMMGAEFHQAWGELLHNVRTGEPGFQKRFGQAFFEYMTERPHRHSVYDAAMGAFGLTETQAVLDAYDFGAYRTVVDVGGGSGVFLTALLSRYPEVRGTLFDLPAVADRARAAAPPESGLNGRLRVEGGDFFASVPPGADVYVMQHIIHDWQDPEAETILRNCWSAMTPGSRVLLVEIVIPPADTPSFGKWLDLMMLLVNGRERTEEEYRRLFSAAGLQLTGVIPTDSDVSIIEGVQAE